MIIYLSLLVALVGTLLYFLSANGKAQEIGRILLLAGLLAFLLQLSPQSVALLGK